MTGICILVERRRGNDCSCSHNPVRRAHSTYIPSALIFGRLVPIAPTLGHRARGMSRRIRPPPAPGTQRLVQAENLQGIDFQNTPSKNECRLVDVVQSPQRSPARSLIELLSFPAALFSSEQGRSIFRRAANPPKSVNELTYESISSVPRSLAGVSSRSGPGRHDRLTAGPA